MDDLAGARWRKSSYSGTESACVELATSSKQTAIRDSKDPEGGMLVLSPATSTALLSSVQRLP